MDPTSLIGGIAQLTLKIVVKINETKEIKESAAELRKLVSAVQAIVTNASSEVEGGKLKRADAIEALQGIKQSLQECLDVITKYSGKKDIVKFLFSGTYLGELKGLASSLARWLSAFHVALGVEQHADIKGEFKDLCRRLEGMQLKMLSAMTTNANGLRSALDQASRDGRDDAQLRRVITEALKDAGVMGASSSSSGGGIPTAVQQKEAVAAIQMELRGLREQKKSQEAEYLETIAELLANASGPQQQPLPPAVQGAPSRGASARQPVARPPPVVVVPASFLCPITLAVMRDPVILVESGHTFERTAIERHFSNRHTNPVTNLPLSSKAVIPNIGLRGAIEEWLQTHGLLLPSLSASSAASPEEADKLGSKKPATVARPVVTQGLAADEEADTLGSKKPAAVARPVVPQVASARLPRESERTDIKLRSASASKEKDLLQASEDGRLASVLEMLQDRTLNPNVFNQDGWTPLHLASLKGHIEVVQLLLAAGANMEAQTENGWTPLYVAAMNGHEAAVKILLDAGADKDKATIGGFTPLHVAACSGHAAVVKYLLGAGADKDKAGSCLGHTPLWVAAMKGHEAAVKCLLDAGADKDKADNVGWTPLYVAAKKGHTAVVKVLLDARADKNKTNVGGWTPLHAAVREGHEVAVKCLLDAGADKDKADNYGQTPLWVAAEKGHMAVVKYLLDAGADKEKANKAGKKPKDVAKAGSGIASLL